MNSFQISFVSAVLLLMAPNAMAANTDSKQRAAKRACLVGDVDKGVGILADLYVDTNDPTYLFNQGRCFEQNGKYDQAVLRFKEYLLKAKNLSPTESDAVLKKINELQGAASQHKAQEPATSSSPVTQPLVVPAATIPATSAASPSGTVAPTPDPLGISRADSPPEPEETPPVYKRWWFWTGVGVVVAGGVVTSVLLSSNSPATRTACDKGVACAP